MSRILLADDSAHAQRMGERILREEGYEVVSVTDGDTAIVRLEDVGPDLVIADALLPGKSGYELCEHVKRNPALRHTRVLLAVGLLEPFDEARAERAGSDGILKKPFEATMMLAAVKPLVEAARIARGVLAETAPEPEPPPRPEIDAALLRAAVTVAVEAALPAVIDDITRRVLDALQRSGEVQISNLPVETARDPEPAAVADVTPAPEESPAGAVDAPEAPSAAEQIPEVAEEFEEASAPEPEHARQETPAEAVAPGPPEPAPAPSDPKPEEPPAEQPPTEPGEPPRMPEWRGFHLFR